MKSGLEGRNNILALGMINKLIVVSMKSGLEGRNNPAGPESGRDPHEYVSMKSGLEGRNNELRRVSPIP